MCIAVDSGYLYLGYELSVIHGDYKCNYFEVGTIFIDYRTVFSGDFHPTEILPGETLKNEIYEKYFWTNYELQPWEEWTVAHSQIERKKNEQTIHFD